MSLPITFNVSLPSVVPPVEPPAPGSETFKVYASLSTRPDKEVLEGDTIDVIEHQGLNVYMDDFTGWDTHDERNLITWIDYGERYDFQYLDASRIASGARMLRGAQAGFYTGLSSGHAYRGTDMFGVKQIDLTTPTKTQTVTCSASRGGVTRTLTFNIRVVEMSAWYKDGTKAIYGGAGNLESRRRGLIYVSRDTDFTGAPPVGPNIYHHTISDGRWTRSTFIGDQTANGGPDYPWDSANNMDAVGVVFKGGQEFFLTEAFTLWSRGSIIGSWGTGNATIDVYDAQQWNDAQLIWNVNAFSDWRFNCFGINWKSNYDQTSPEIREWWNILNYSSKTGEFVPNELLTNAGNTAYTEVLYDTGTSLLVRQVVDTADINLQTNSLAAFSDGETLTSTSGASITFVAAGSRQDRTQRQPAVLWGVTMQNCTLDGCVIEGFDEGVSAAGFGNVVNDCDIFKSFDYGVYIASRNPIWSSVMGVNIRQPFGYISEPVATRLSLNGDGDWTPEAVAGNRGQWNVYDATFLNTNIYSNIPVVENRVRHSAMRCPGGGIYNFHNCHVYWNGGHGAGHQALFRFLTGGTEAPDFTLVSMVGCAMVGGLLPFTGFASVSGFLYHPKSFVVDACHFLSVDQVSDGVQILRIELPDTTFKNCIIEAPSGATLSGGGDISFFFSFTTPPQDAPSSDLGDPQPANVYDGGKNIVIEGNTFIVQSDYATSEAVTANDTDLRSSSILYEWRNNAWIIDPTKVTSIAADRLALNENPANFTADWRPQVGAIAYQSAVPPILDMDAEGTTRPANASKGALEPT